MKEAKKLTGYKRPVHKQLLQVSGLCGTPFLSYSRKHFTQLYRSLYGDNMSVYLSGTPTWQPEINNKTSHLEFAFAMKALSFRL